LQDIAATWQLLHSHPLTHPQYMNDLVRDRSRVKKDVGNA
jgi:hypothetical protein